MLIAQAAPSLELIQPWMTTILSLGGWGFVLVALLFGWVVTKKAYDQLLQDRDMWRERSDKEHDLRVKAEETAQTALIQGQATVKALQELSEKATRRTKS